MAGYKISRAAEQTTRLIQALAGRTTRSQQVHTSANGMLTPKTEKTSAGAQESTSTMSSLTASPATPGSLKRKREGASPRTPKVTRIMEEEVSIQTSPRKAGGAADEKPKKSRRQPAKKIRGDDGDIKFEPPPKWEEVYNTTQEMRSRVLAPVDTMGCENLAEDTRTPRDRRFQTLVALMLSSQTKDTVTAVAMKNLQDELPGGFTLESMLAVEPAVLNGLISKVGFHNNKTKFIKAATEILRNQHGSDIPDTIDGLVALPGVGPKMAYLCMSAAWGRDEGIGVDVHVHRITNLWGWHKTNTPEETRAILESWLPREKWHDINHLLVGFGQTWCPPVGRKCDECLLSAKGLCPSAVVGKKVTKKVKKEDVVVKKEGGSTPVIKKEVDVDMKISSVKAENLSPSVASPTPSHTVPDIEDLAGRRRSTRLAS